MLKKKSIITSIGNATVDIFFYTDEASLIRNGSDVTKKRLLAFEYGAKITSDDVHFCLGGGGANSAMTFSRMGLRPSLISSIGSDAFGQEIIKNMQAAQVQTAAVQRQSAEQTAFAFVVGGRKWQDHVLFHHSGASDQLSLTTAMMQKLATPWLYVTAFRTTRWTPNFAALMQAVARKSLKMYWNPNPKEIIDNWTKVKKYLPLMEGLQLNLDEALEVLHSRGHQVKSLQPKGAIRLLHEFGQNLTVITNGDKGAYVYDGKKIIYKSSPATKIISTTGAGDAFGSGFVSGLIRFQGNLNRSLALAVHNATSVLTEVGAQKGLLTERDIKRLNV